jgi:hypothetical protein
MTPVWVIDQQWKDLDPPAWVLAYGDAPRSPEKLLDATRSLQVKTSKRYAPTGVTFCNIYLSDVMQILKAPVPHWYDLSDGRGRREMRANDIVDGMRAGKFPGWSSLGVLASGQLAASNHAAVGLPAFAAWKNPKGPGHVTPVVPTPPGKTGVYVSGAGRQCVEECPLAQAYGPHTPEVEFFGYSH